MLWKDGKGAMDIFDAAKLSSMVENDKRLFQGLLPELVKKLILNSCTGVSYVRIPSMDDVWAPGFDGVVENSQATPYVCSGKSIWEFGTNSDSLRKINSDYDKRTQNSLGIDKSQTEFYMIVPHIWAYDNQRCSITQWEDQHKGDWKRVHVFDAAILSAWINSEPAVGAWLIEKTGAEENMDFSSVASAWTHFSSKTSPAFSPSLFLGGREKYQKTLWDMWSCPIIKIKADSVIDAYGFCLASILENSEKSNTVIVINNERTYKQLARFCHNKTFLLNFKLDGDVMEGNRVILCYNKADRTIPADITLCQLPKSLFNMSMKDMGVSGIKATDLYAQTHGNLLSLIRKIPGKTTGSRPQWTFQERIDLLAPVLLLREFDTQNECDKNLVSFLADEKYEVVFERYKSWLATEDAPIKCVGNHIVLVDFEATWNVLCLTPADPVFERFSQAIFGILSYDPQHSYGGFADSRSNRHMYNLTLDIVYFSHVTEQADKVNDLVKTLIEKFISSDCLMDHLVLLAEAAPAIVMHFLLDDTKSSAGMVADGFENHAYSKTGEKILYALDELVLHEETRVAACDLLFELCLKTGDSHFKTSNSPREVLLNALCLWNDHTLFTVEDKTELVKRYLAIDEKYMVQFATDLILKKHTFFGVRDGSKLFLKTTVYNDELCKAQNDIGAILFEYYRKNCMIDGIEKLLNGYQHFDIETLKVEAELFSVDDYDLEAIVPLNYSVRERARFAAQNDHDKPWVPALEAWVNATTPSDSVGCVGWMFCDYYSLLLRELLKKNDSDHYDEQLIAEKRAVILDELVQNNDRKEMVKLLRCSQDNVLIGRFYAQHLDAEMLFDFVNEARRLGKTDILRGLLDGAGREECIRALDTLTPAEQQTVLQKLERKDIMDWIDTPEKERSYWSYKIMQEYDEIAYSKLLIYNPRGILWYFWGAERENIISNIEKIMDVINAMLSGESTVSDNPVIYELDDVIEKVDQGGYYSEEWAAMCMKAYDRGWLGQYPAVLRKYYFTHPVLLCEKIKNPNNTIYAQFSLYYELPADAYADQPGFDSFVQTFIEKHTTDDLLLSILGSILGKSPNGTDGIFPHEYVRSALEQYKDFELWRAVLLGKMNAQGVRSIEDGTAEMKYAKKYKDDALKIEVKSPETAKLLRMLSEDYANQGKRDQLLSEIGLSAWRS